MTTTLPQEFETITGILGDDHDRLDRLLDDAYDLLATEPGKARQKFSAFASGLKHHIEIEDQLLFEAFEKHTGMRDVGPTAVMRREHREIEARLGQIANALAAKSFDTDEVAGEIAALRALLADHNNREEGVLYPACDRMLARAEVRMVRSALERR